jgi:hypothetical protein
MLAGQARSFSRGFSSVSSLRYHLLKEIRCRNLLLGLGKRRCLCSEELSGVDFLRC